MALGVTFTIFSTVFFNVSAFLSSPIRWLLSTAFITGYIPSLLMLFCWAVLVYLLTTTFWVASGTPVERKQSTGVSTSTATTLNPLSSGLSSRGESELPDSKVLGLEKTVESTAAGAAGAAAATFRGERVDSLRMWSMFLLNVLIVGAVNGLYIYSTLQSYSVESRVLIQYAGACTSVCAAHVPLSFIVFLFVLCLGLVVMVDSPGKLQCHHLLAPNSTLCAV